MHSDNLVSTRLVSGWLVETNGGGPAFGGTSRLRADDGGCAERVHALRAGITVTGAAESRAAALRRPIGCRACWDQLGRHGRSEDRVACA